MASVVDCIERATSDLLIGPDWAINIEICDILNSDPKQVKDALKMLKKKLTSKSPQVQLLSLSVLDALNKNCGENVHLQIVERDILHEMMKIVKKKSDLNVRENILMLLDVWREAFRGFGGKYTQYNAAYQELKNAGVEYPPRLDNSVPLFTPPQSEPIVQHMDSPVFGDPPVEASLHALDADFSLEETQHARGISSVLMDMLNAMDPHNSEEIKQEIVTDLVEQCQSYQKRIMLAVDFIVDENLLSQCLVANDDLQKAICRYNDMIKPIPSTMLNQTTQEPNKSASSLAPSPFINFSPDDDESEDELSQLAHRSSKGNNGFGKDLTEDSDGCMILPPPPPPFIRGDDAIDYLSPDFLKSELSKSFGSSLGNTQSSQSLLNSFAAQPPSRSNDSDTHVASSGNVQSAPAETHPPNLIPPPPAKYSQRQQFFEKQQLSTRHHPTYDEVLGQTKALSINKADGASASQDSSPLQGQHPKSEDVLFKDLVDFAKAKSTTAFSKSNGSRD